MSDKSKLRDEYYDKFTLTDDRIGGSLKKLSVAPHDLFEWFWKKHQEKIKDEKLELLKRFELEPQEGSSDLIFGYNSVVNAQNKMIAELKQQILGEGDDSV